MLFVAPWITRSFILGNRRRPFTWETVRYADRMPTSLLQSLLSVLAQPTACFGEFVDWGQHVYFRSMCLCGSRIAVTYRRAEQDRAVLFKAGLHSYVQVLFPRTALVC